MNKCLDRLGHCIRYLWRIDILHNAFTSHVSWANHSIIFPLAQIQVNVQVRLDQCYQVAKIYILDLISSESALSFSISPEVVGQLMPRPSVSFGFGI